MPACPRTFCAWSQPPPSNPHPCSCGHIHPSRHQDPGYHHARPTARLPSRLTAPYPVSPQLASQLRTHPQRHQDLLHQSVGGQVVAWARGHASCRGAAWIGLLLRCPLLFPPTLPGNLHLWCWPCCRSQPPLYSEMVRVVYEATGNRTMLRWVGGRSGGGGRGDCVWTWICAPNALWVMPPGGQRWIKQRPE